MIKKVSQIVDSDEITTNSEESDEYFVTNIFNNRPRKRTKLGQITTEVVGEIVDRDNNVTPLRCLLDTGTTSTIILKPFVAKLSKYKTVKTKWKTMGGVFETRKKAQ